MHNAKKVTKNEIVRKIGLTVSVIYVVPGGCDFSQRVIQVDRQKSVLMFQIRMRMGCGSVTSKMTIFISDTCSMTYRHKPISAVKVTKCDLRDYQLSKGFMVR